MWKWQHALQTFLSVKRQDGNAVFTSAVHVDLLEGQLLLAIWLPCKLTGGKKPFWLRAEVHCCTWFLFWKLCIRKITKPFDFPPPVYSFQITWVGQRMYIVVWIKNLALEHYTKPSEALGVYCVRGERTALHWIWLLISQFSEQLHSQRGWQYKMHFSW